MTFLTERVPLDRIEHRARHARPGRWVACRLCAVAWLAVAWCAAAAIEGWQSAKTGHSPQ